MLRIPSYVKACFLIHDFVQHASKASCKLRIKTHRFLYCIKLLFDIQFLTPTGRKENKSYLLCVHFELKNLGTGTGISICFISIRTRECAYIHSRI